MNSKNPISKNRYFAKRSLFYRFDTAVPMLMLNKLRSKESVGGYPRKPIRQKIAIQCKPTKSSSVEGSISIVFECYRNFVRTGKLEMRKEYSDDYRQARKFVKKTGLLTQMLNGDNLHFFDEIRLLTYPGSWGEMKRDAFMPDEDGLLRFIREKYQAFLV